jgi:outer membrane lipoprotein-sorting protein
MTQRFGLCSALAVGLCLVSACGARRVTLPSGPAAPFADFPVIYEQATKACRDVTSMTASLALSGRTDGGRLAGRIDTGLAAPSRIRLELFPPMSFGRAAFVLAASGEQATLFLPRENRVLRGSPPQEIVQRLAGVPLDGAELRTVLSGCGLSVGTPGEGRSYKNGWVAADSEGTTIYLRQLDGQWRVAAASRGPVTVQYGRYDVASGRPQEVTLRTTSVVSENGRTPETHLTVKLSDVQINVPLGDEVFEVQVPPDAVPFTLDELKPGIGKGEGARELVLSPAGGNYRSGQASR